MSEENSTYGGMTYGGSLYEGLPAAPDLSENLSVDSINTILEVENLVKRFKKGDERPIVKDTLKKNGSPVDLTGATVYFSYKKPSGATAKKEAEITDAQNGVVEYNWEDGEIDEPDIWEQEWVVVFSDGRDATFPNSGTEEFDVDERLVE